MAEKIKYLVAREHFGDKMYHEGDERFLIEMDAKRLLAQGVLKEFEDKPEIKADPKPANKARKAAPENK